MFILIKLKFSWSCYLLCVLLYWYEHDFKSLINDDRWIKWKMINLKKIKKLEYILWKFMDKIYR